ncbi:MAG: BON domain-containing protein [Desulfopila sp.]
MFESQKIIKFLVLLVMTVAFLGCASTQKQSSPGDYIDDTVITTKVKAAIFDDPALRMREISVETRQGVVQLSGFVDSAQSVTKAGQVARGVAGVKSVKNDLIVK